MARTARNTRRRRGPLPTARRLFRQLHPVGKILVGLIAPVTAIIGTLLALNVIRPFGQDALASAIERTEEAASAVIGLRFESQGTTFSSIGKYDYRSARGSFRYDFEAAATNVEARFDHRHVYVRLGDSKARRPWVHLDLAVAQEQIADYAKAAGKPVAVRDLTFLSRLNFSDPARALNELKRAASFKDLGDAELFNVATTRYRAVIHPQDGEGERLVANAFVDRQDRIRRLRLESQAGTEPFTLTMDLSHFGAPIDVVLPSNERVRELEDLLRQIYAGAAAAP